MNTHTYSDNPNKSMNSKTINLKPFLTTTLILTLGIIGLANTISQALPAIHSPLKSAWMSDFEGNPIEIIQTPEIESINLYTKKEITETIENLNKVDPQKPTPNAKDQEF